MCSILYIYAYILACEDGTLRYPGYCDPVTGLPRVTRQLPHNHHPENRDYQLAM